MIRNVGLRNLPSSTSFSKTFHPEHMFCNKKHGIERKLNVEVGISNFFNFETQDLSDVVLSSATACTVLGSQLIPVKSWINGTLNFTQLVGSAGVRKWVLVPLAISVSGGILWYIISDIPPAVLRRIARKVWRELERVDYVNHNADRITRELRTVLSVLEKYLREQFHKDIEERARAKEECISAAQMATSACKFFTRLKEEAITVRMIVMGYALGPVAEAAL
jgi:hypothetical protein